MPLPVFGRKNQTDLGKAMFGKMDNYGVREEQSFRAVG